MFFHFTFDIQQLIIGYILFNRFYYLLGIHSFIYLKKKPYMYIKILYTDVL